ASYDGKEEPFFLRVAPRGDNILIDLCDKKWRVIEVSRNGWQILDRSPVAFFRTGSMQPLPEPVRGGSIETLWELLNVTKAQRPLVAGAFLKAFQPGGPFLILNYVGGQGTRKKGAWRINGQAVYAKPN